MTSPSSTGSRRRAWAMSAAFRRLMWPPSRALRTVATSQGTSPAKAVRVRSRRSSWRCSQTPSTWTVPVRRASTGVAMVAGFLIGVGAVEGGDADP